MKTSRSVLIWSTLALCALMVLGAMSWLTRGVLASEKERALAQARADLEECTRLALWRMDAMGAAIVSGENSHPPADYQPGATAFPANKDPLAKLHFELRENGNLTCPDSAASAVMLPELRVLLGGNPIPGAEWSMLKCAADASETAWGQLPKDAPLVKANITKQRMPNSRAGNRVDQAYQADFNGVEKAQRAKNVEEVVANSYQYGNNEIQLAEPAPVSPVSPGKSGPVITDLGAMRAIWIGGELFLLRQFSTALSDATGKGVQGVWLDQEVLKQRLLDEVKDLLPIAGLESAIDSAGDPLALVSFPFRVVRNEGTPPVRSSINGPLAVGWGAVLLAILTASLLVHGVMRLSERRASFVSAVTHELRTPLTTFRLYSDMLESGAVREEKRGDYLRVLSREADRLSHLVENVLSFSKIERGSARSVVRETTVNDLLEPMRERLVARLTTANLALQMDVSCDLRVRVDSAAVEHILFNLIDNAAKYASTGIPPKVEIKVRSSDRKVEIIVTDHGPGIPESERRRIFRAFHKSAREAAESRPGVGLGLALSRRLARSLGGGLECVDSKQGACFVLSLPLA
jgi:signal transduction histidine kinase